jgi:hypothetical protein
MHFSGMEPSSFGLLTALKIMTAFDAAFWGAYVH